VLVAEECCGDPDEGQHRSNLADVGRRYADVWKAEEVEDYFARLPA
jgi:maleamate amidohydrolase